MNYWNAPIRWRQRPRSASFRIAKETMTCIFCEIVADRAPASFVYRDELISAFMTLQPTAPGECCVIPNAHVDHFTDLPDAIAAHIVIVAQSIGRQMRKTFSPERVGYLVHG